MNSVDFGNVYVGQRQSGKTTWLDNIIKDYDDTNVGW